MQNITLTPEERQVVLNYATRLEKRSRHWRVFRWLAIGCFAFSIALVLWAQQLSAKLRTTVEPPPEALKISQTGGIKSIEGSLQVLAAYNRAEVTALRAEFYVVLRALVVAGMATALFAYTVSNWNRDRRDRLVVRLLRLTVSEDNQRDVT